MLDVNGGKHQVQVEPDTPLLYVLRNDLGLTGAKLGCGLEQCYACAVLVDGKETPSCVAPVASFVGKQVTAPVDQVRCAGHDPAALGAAALELFGLRR